MLVNWAITERANINKQFGPIISSEENENSRYLDRSKVRALITLYLFIGWLTNFEVIRCFQTDHHSQFQSDFGWIMIYLAISKWFNHLEGPYINPRRAQLRIRGQQSFIYEQGMNFRGIYRRNEWDIQFTDVLSRVPPYSRRKMGREKERAFARKWSAARRARGVCADRDCKIGGVTTGCFSGIGVVQAYGDADHSRDRHWRASSCKSHFLQVP